MALDGTKYIGQKFGKRTILRSAPPNGATVRVEAQCDCGNINMVGLSALLNGRCNGCMVCSLYRDKVHRRTNAYGEFK